ncbi:MAG: hypothetical protein AB1489_26675 [Acidobacteriota bacterium]
MIIDDKQEALQKSFNYLTSKLAVADPTAEFQVLDFVKDELGISHLRLQQCYQGLSVFGQHLIVHIGKDGEVSNITGEYREGVVGIGTQPRLSNSEAIKIACNDFAIEISDVYTAELVIYPEPSSIINYLTYLVTLPLWRDNTPVRLRYFIDANTGKVIDCYNDRTTATNLL